MKFHFQIRFACCIPVGTRRCRVLVLRRCLVLVLRGYRILALKVNLQKFLNRILPFIHDYLLAVTDTAAPKEHRGERSRVPT